MDIGSSNNNKGLNNPTVTTTSTVGNTAGKANTGSSLPALADQKILAANNILKFLNLKVGDIVQAKVIQSSLLKPNTNPNTNEKSSNNPRYLPAEPAKQPSPNQHKAFVISLNVSGKLFTASSQYPLQPNQHLSVKAIDARTLQVLNIKIPLSSQFNSLVQEQIRAALPQQSPPAKLLASLLSLATNYQIPVNKQLRQSIQQLLQQLYTPKQLSHVAHIKKALNHSGVLFESKLKAVAQKDRSKVDNAPSPNLPIKGSTRQEAGTTKRLLNDFKGVMLQLLKQLPQTQEKIAQSPGQPLVKPHHSQQLTYNSIKPKVTNEATNTTDNRAIKSSGLTPTVAQPGAKQVKTISPPLDKPAMDKPVMDKPVIDKPVIDKPLIDKSAALEKAQQAIPTNDSKKTTTNQANEKLLNTIQRQVTETLARLLIHQMTTLNKQQVTSQDNQPHQFFQTEIPILNGNHIETVLIKFEENGHHQGNKDDSEKTKEWVLTLAFDLSLLGTMHVQVKLANDIVNAKFWAEKSSTLEKIQDNSEYLANNLHNAGVELNKLECCQGPPPNMSTGLDYTLVDIET